MAVSVASSTLRLHSVYKVGDYAAHEQCEGGVSNNRLALEFADLFRAA